MIGPLGDQHLGPGRARRRKFARWTSIGAARQGKGLGAEVLDRGQGILVAIVRLGEALAEREGDPLVFGVVAGQVGRRLADGPLVAVEDRQGDADLDVAVVTLPNSQL